MVVLEHYKHSGSSSFLSLLIKKILTVTEIFSPPDPHNLALRCLVNGESVQSSNTNQMIFKTEVLVSWVSKYIPLCAFFSLHMMALLGGWQGGFGLTRTFCFT